MQQKTLSKLLVQRDPRYKSRLVTLVILRVLQSGKKFLARKIVYKAMKLIQVEFRRRPLDLLKNAIRRGIPKAGTRKRRVRKRVFHAPIDIKLFSGVRLSIRWIVQGARIRRARTMWRRLALELIETRKGKGYANRKKHQLHKLADAYRAFKRKKKWWRRKEDGGANSRSEKRIKAIEKPR
jgi:small subunit ribosomal protein S7